MFKLIISTIVLFIFTQNLNAAALECQVDDYYFQNMEVISINSLDLTIKPLVSMGEIPSFFSIKVDTHFSELAQNLKQKGELVKMIIDSGLHFYLNPKNNYMDGFYIIKKGDFITKLDSFCSFNLLSNYQSEFILFDERQL